MTTYPELELGLAGSAPVYTLSMRFRHPASAADDELLAGPAPSFTPDAQQLRERWSDPAAYGAALSAMLFASEAARLALARARAAAQALGLPLRLRLAIAPDAAELHLLRWETLRDPVDPERSLAGGQLFFSRYLSAAGDLRPVRRPQAGELRALAAVAAPSDSAAYGLAPIDRAAEQERLIAALGATPVRLLAAPGQPGLDAIRAELREGVAILYLVAHGRLRDGEPLLWLERPDGAAEVVRGDALAAALSDLVQRPVLAILASCQSAAAESDAAMAALGPRLVAAGVPAVLAMAGNLTLATAAALLPAFLRELLRDGQVDRALGEARLAVRGQDDWWAPVLFLRLRDGRLWEGEAVPPRVPGSSSPYLGLSTFTEAHADLFFGRAALVAQLIEKARGRRLLTVIGPSGSGKSSAVLAGLLPALRQGALPDSAGWTYLTMRPGARPLDALAAVLGGDKLGEISAIRRALADDDRALLLAADRLAAGGRQRTLALVIDQFEELYTLAPQPGEGQQERFVHLLLAAVTAPDSSLLAIITMRADFIHRAAENRELAAQIAEHLAIVSPMTADELREAIERPAALAGCRFEPGLVDELIDQVEGRAGALPLLEYTLQELWRARARDGTLTWAALRDLGGVEGALARRADELLSTHYTAEQQRELRAIMLRLVQPGEGALDTRRRALLDDLVPVDSSSVAVQALLKPLADERLLTTGQDTASGEETVEISHEALIRAWPTFSAWVSEARDDLRQQLQLEEAARQWEQSDESADFLWAGLRLATARAWVARSRPALTGPESRFLRQSEERETARRAAEEAAKQRELLLEERAGNARRNARRIAAFAGVVTLLALVAGGLAVFAYNAGQVAQAQARGASALVEQEVARPDRALLLARAASTDLGANPFYDLPVSRALRAALERTTPSRFLDGLDTGHSNEIWVTAFDRAGARALTGSRDYTARVWDADSGALLQILGENGEHSDYIFDAAFSPDDSRIATASGDRTARIWDAASGASLATLAGHSDHVLAVAWHPDGARLATASRDRTVRLWGADGQPLRTLEGHTRPVTVLAWSPSGDRLLTAGEDGTARIWDPASGRMLRVLGTPPQASTAGAADSEPLPIRAIVWMPDGERVLTAGESGYIRLWDARSGTLVDERRLDEGSSVVVPIITIALHPDGEQLATGDDRGRVVLWTVEADGLFFGSVDVPSHNRRVWRVIWSPDGDWLLSASDDQTAHVWHRPTGELLRLQGHSGPVAAAAWNPNGREVLTGSADFTARRWSVGLQPLQWAPLPREQAVEAIYGAAWSPDGARVVIGREDGAAIVLTPRLSGRQSREGQPAGLVAIPGHFQAAICAVAFSPDGARVATASIDGTVKIWSAADGAEERTLRIVEQDGRSQGYVNAVAWSPDGTLLAVGADDGLVTLWDAAAWQPVRAFSGHSPAGRAQRVLAVAWSPDGARLVSGDDIGTVIVWEAASAAEIWRLRGHTFYVRSVAWSGDGAHIASVGDDQTMRLWDAASGELRHALEGADNTLRAVVFSPDSALVAAGGDDAQIRIWDAASGRPVQVIAGQQDRGIFALAWSPDGHTLFSGDYFGLARVILVDQRLLRAEVTRRVCSIFDDVTIGRAIAGWEGCVASLAQEAAAIAAYDALREQPFSP